MPWHKLIIKKRKVITTILLLSIAVYFAPSIPIDPWGLISLKKVISLLLALSAIQIMAEGFAHLLGRRSGNILTGLLGGLISSTALTASIARESKLSADRNGEFIVVYLSGILGMLLQGLGLSLAGLGEIHPAPLLIFGIPLLSISIFIFYLNREHRTIQHEYQEKDFDLIGLIKIVIFIAVVIAGSKALEKTLGESGLYLLTFIVSLFEIHGSIIANTQLFSSGSIGINALSTLLSISITASFVSKILIIMMLGHARLKIQVLKSAIVVLAALGIALLFQRFHWPY